MLFATPTVCVNALPETASGGSSPVTSRYISAPMEGGVDDVQKAAPPGVLMPGHRDAVDEIEDLIFHKRRSGEEGDDVASFARTLHQRVAISAVQPAKGDDTGEIVALDPSGAP